MLNASRLRRQPFGGFRHRPVLHSRDEFRRLVADGLVHGGRFCALVMRPKYNGRMIERLRRGASAASPRFSMPQK